MTTQINQLTELTTTSDDDLILIRENSTGIDKKMKAQNIRAKATTKADVGLGNVTNDAQFKLADAGTAATANVTTSATDTTANRLLKVGDFGVGVEQSPSSVDLDDAIQNNIGFQVIRTPLGADNTPPGHSSVNFIQNFSRQNGERGFQVALDSPGTGSTKISIRGYGSAGILPWRVLYHTGNLLGTVSQSAGVPTGAVIERGSNANGEFVRFADGTQICTFIRIIENLNYATDFPYRQSAAAWPIAFTTAPTQIHQAQSFGATSGLANRPPVLGTIGGRFADDLFTSSAYRAVYHVAGTAPGADSVRNFRFISLAIGRWY